VIGEGILTAIQRNTIRVLTEIPNTQVTLMSGITTYLGLVVYFNFMLHKRYISCQISPSLQKKPKEGWRRLSVRYTQNKHKNVGTFQFKMQVKNITKCTVSCDILRNM
jgi:hypothetical protein